MNTKINPDIAYFRKNILRGLNPSKAQLELMEDAVVVYHEHRLPSEQIKAWQQFGLTQQEAIALIIRNKYLRQIPTSLLVQTFMRKLQNGMDRRRP